MASRLPPALPLLLAASLAVAGCASHAGAPDATTDSRGSGVQHVDEKEIESTSDVQPDRPNATLMVHVTDANGQPVPKAFVSLVGRPLSGSTNSNGVITFEQLEPGALRVRVDADLFRSQEVNLTLVKGERKEIVLKLEPVEGFEAGSRGHFHDYWSGATEATLFTDVTWDIHCYATYCFNSQNQAVRNWALPDNAIVYPGAGEIELTAKWSGTATQPITLAMGGPGFSYSPNKLKFTTSGEKARFKIAAHNADDPHAHISAWFVRYYEVATENPGLFTGPLVLSLKIFRGDFELPFDPPHPNEWGERTRVRIADQTLKHGYVSYRSYTGEVFFQAVSGYTAPTSDGFFFGQKVLNGAATLEVRAKINSSTAASGQGLAFEYVPRKPTSFSAGADMWVRAPKATVEGPTYKWDLPLNPATWDPFYAKFSGWKWRVFQADERTQDQGAFVGDVYVTLEIVKGV